MTKWENIILRWYYHLNGQYICGSSEWVNGEMEGCDLMDEVEALKITPSQMWIVAL